MQFEYVQQWNGKFRVQEVGVFNPRVVAHDLTRREAKDLANELMTCECGHHLYVHYDTGLNPGCYGCAECPAGHKHAHRNNRLGHKFNDHCACLVFRQRKPVSAEGASSPDLKVGVSAPVLESLG